MDTYSAFQTANPLSPRKFWKKYLGRLVSNVIVLTIFSGLASFLYMFLNINLHDTGADLAVSDVIHASIAVSSIVVAVYLIVYALYIKAYIRRYYYDAGEQFITIKKGVFTPREIHVQYGKIQDVYVDQDILDRMLGLYDVHIASATIASGIEAHIDGVEKGVAENIKTALLGRITGHAAVPQAAPQAAVQPAFNGAISSDTYPPSSLYLLITTVKSALFWIAAVVIFFGKNPGAFSLSLTVLILAGIIVASMLYNFIWFKNYSFSFNQDMLVLKTRVLAANETHVPYRTIQDVVLNQGIFERVFGLATVTIQNATAVSYNRRNQQTGTVIIAQPVAKANEIVAAVRSIIAQTNSTSTGL